MRITSVLGGSPIEREILRKYEEEYCIIAGTSAMSKTMIYGGEGRVVLRKGTINVSTGMGLIDRGDLKVVVDYGHNIGVIKATGDFIRGLMPGRKIRMASGVGNRRREDILEFGKTLAKYYDHIVICDTDPRQRAVGETAEIAKEGLLQGGFKPEMITMITDEREATKVSLEMAKPGDVVVLQVDDIAQVIKDVLDYKAKLAGSRQR